MTVLSVFAVTAALAAAGVDDAYIERDGDTWVMGTSAVRRIVALEDGKFVLKSFCSKATGRELAARAGGAEEFAASLDDGRRVSSAVGPWKLDGEQRTRLKQGEQQLAITVQQGPLAVTKYYVVHPGSSVIRQWATFANVGQQPLKIVEPTFLHCTARLGQPQDLDFHWMTGGQSVSGSWLLKTEKLTAGKARQFDSYEPFPGEPESGPRGDGVNVRIRRGATPIWPERGWQYVASAAVTVRFDVTTEVAAGEQLLFVANMNGNIGYDTTAFDPTLYFQRLSRDRLRGIIIPKRPAPKPTIIHPKGLLPEETYLVSFHESAATERRSGADLMQRGISIAKMPPGELVYLNLPLHPGSKDDRSPPSPPRQVVKSRGENMGYPGIELAWKPGTDDNWVSYYLVLRNGIEIEKVAKGAYHFDHSAGADLAANYEVRTVDGAGNLSAKVAASGPAARPARIADDAPAGGLTFAGSWEHESNLQPAHAGTISRSTQPGATVKWTFEGRQVLWFSKLGADGGKAAVAIDGSPAGIVDTYSADDIWGVCVYRQTLPAAGRHTVEIRVLGERGPRSKGSAVYLDGLRAED